MEDKQQQFESRLKSFHFRIIRLTKSLPKTTENIIYSKQVIRSSSSVGANYAEATCAFTPPDFLHDMNKCRKESKETIYWLEVIYEANPDFQSKMEELIDESKQLLKIFTSSVMTSKNNQKSIKSKNKSKL